MDGQAAASTAQPASNGDLGETPQREQAEEVDPLMQLDPWRNGGGDGSARETDEAETDATMPHPSFERRRGDGGTPYQAPAPTFAQVTLPSQDHGVSQRIIHDVPPVWDGKDPDNMCEPYLKLLRGCCLLYTSPSPRDGLLSRMPSSA